MIEQVPAMPADVFAELIDNCDDAFFRLQLHDNQLTYLSQAFNKLWNRPGIVFLADPLLFIRDVHPDDRERVKGTLQDILKNEQTGPVDFRIITTEPAKWIRFKVLSLKNGVLSGMLSDISDIKNETERLANENQNLISAQLLSGTGSFVRYLNDGRADWSDEAKRIYEFEIDSEISHEQVRERIHPDDLPLVLRKWDEAIAGKQVVNFDYRIILPGGRIKHLTQFCKPEFDSEGNTIHFTGALSDVTSSRAVKLNLQKAQRKLLVAQKLARLGSFEFTLADGKLESTPQTYQILGINLQQAITVADIFNSIHPDDRENVIGSWNKLIASPAGLNIDCRIVHPSGNTIYVNLIVDAVADKNGKTTQLVGTIQDINERKLAEERLKDSEEKFRIAQRIAKMGSYELDLVNGVNHYSDEFFQLQGIETEEARNHFSASLTTNLSNSAWPYIDPSDRVKVGAVIAECISERKNFNVEYQYTKPNGEVQFISSIGSFLTEASSGTDKLFGIIQDITKIKLVEKEFIAEKERAESATVAKTQFLSTMSHEIRTPLNAVIGTTYLLLQDAVDPEQKEKLQILKFSAENLLTLINDILDFNKIEAGKIEFEEADFDLDRILADIRNSYSQKAAEKDIRFLIRKDLSLPKMLVGDSARLIQVLNNLLSNAFKFTEKGSVVLQVDLREQTTDHCDLYFSVTDTGVGIPEDKLEYIFDRFTQASSDTTRKFGGTGLGLAISRKLLQLQGSDISVKSALGEGAEFAFEVRFHLSDHENNKPDIANPTLTQNMDLGAARILVVEDNFINQRVVAEFLKRWNAKIDFAENGLIAIDKIQSNIYDLVLMDLQMPEMDGYQATRYVRQLEGAYYQQLPIIALTASALLDVRQEVSRSGMNDFITKPFNPADLYDKITLYLDKKQNN